MTADKLAAYQTLHCCLLTVSKLIAPITPFYADMLYRDLSQDDTMSVHLTDFPEADNSLVDADLEARMQLAQDLTSMVLALRRKSDIKVRQPLQAVMVPVLDDEQRRRVTAIADLVKSEVNVKEVRLVDGDSGVLVKRVKPDFKKLGPKFGKLMKGVAAALTSMPQPDIIAMERDGAATIVVDGQPQRVELADVEIISEDIPGWLVTSDGSLTVALDITVTPELQREGMARELVNRVQNIRKAADFEITDKINLTIAPDPHTDEAIAAHGDMIASQVLAAAITVAPLQPGQPGVTVLDMDGWSLAVKVVKA